MSGMPALGKNIGLAVSDAQPVPADTVYVAPDGNDCGRGTSDSPYYSLNKAVEGRLSVDESADTLFISVAPGDYYMSEPFSIEQPCSRPVVIKAGGEEKPRFIGGIPVSGWQPCGNGLYKAYVPEVRKYGFDFEQFYVNGRRAVLARTPNDKWNFVKSSKETDFVKSGRMADYAVQQIDFTPEDWESLKGITAAELKDMKFRFYHKWDNTRKSPRYVEADSARIYMDGRGMKPWNPIAEGSRYVMYDYASALDECGEWYLDRNTGYVYYKPFEGEDMDSAFCIAPVLHQWVYICGTTDNPVRNIRFEGLSFQYSSYMMPAGGDEPMQAAASIEAAMQFDFVENVKLQDCEMMHTGGYAVWFARECHHNKINHCYISDLGAGGIKIGEPYFRTAFRQVSSFNEIDNNIITDTGYEHPCGVGIALFHASDNKVTHNSIFDVKYSGISVGWVWGYDLDYNTDIPAMTDDGKMVTVNRKLQSPAVRNIVLYNHIHHLGWGELSDMGAVYTLGGSEGTKVSNNFIHDVWTYDYGGWGLYTDEGSTGVEMSNNLVVRCKNGGFHQHYGMENKIVNNIFAFGYHHQAQLTRDEPHLSLHFKHNIVIQDTGKTLVGNWKNAVTDTDSNLYWHTNADTLSFAGMQFKAWKKEIEPHSINADPMFNDALHDDFTFRSCRNIRRIGFKPFDYSAAGVYGDAEWRLKAVMSPEKYDKFKTISPQIK